VGILYTAALEPVIFCTAHRGSSSGDSLEEENAIVSQ